MFEIIGDGGVTSPKGFTAGATYAGLKTERDTLDLGILFSDMPAVAAATFTQNSVVSPSVIVSRNRLSNDTHRGIVVNSGCANCSVGSQGVLDAEEMISLASKNLEVSPDDLFVASTGMIGVELPMALIRQNIGNIKLDNNSGSDFAKSMMTTDTYHKERAVSFIHDGETVVIGGASKGVGMIHPNMATMLCFISTDANVDKLFLQEVLSDVVNDSFNMIDVDGDQSTNDSVILLANGASETSQINKGSDSADAFKEALSYVCVELAKELVKDGEGAKTLVEVSVEGARTKEDARKSSRAIASSILVKAMVHGKDPNWGRIVMALGSSGIDIEENKIDVFISDIHIVSKGIAIPYYKDAVVSAMADKEVHFKVNLNLGEYSANAWGCDLTEDYVVFNSAYST
ncbi:MAG: bifunctional glutamate N-acetyltransferase/amino-acid acetyltransferase ArgJ [SAR202 cluster bacterium]|nr:bifunctional ornithine acetyltransferase/N-acetylglutamate synthase [Chloroflexota bacterium]MQG22525.1 bifunctional glutamate N-acetyltransferase/amino-acid acetyltransferase ArgJ [SAR202 cluster bacterium]|tara:strand:- start:10981 stop:12186 length:1206 start_codon:yes stop_codon:yes gene_type:complete